MELAVNGQVQAFITPSIIHIVGYWLTKAYGNAKAKKMLLTLLADVSVIDVDHGYFDAPFSVTIYCLLQE